MPAYLGSSTNEFVNGFFADLALQIPKRQIHNRDSRHGDTLSAIEDARLKHLVPDPVCITRIGTDDETGEVFLDQPACWGTTEAGGEAHSPV